MGRMVEVGRRGVEEMVIESVGRERGYRIERWIEREDGRIRVRFRC